MGYKLINYIDALDYNTKRFFLDNGAIDLPPITNHTDIQPGSEAHDINSKDMWILNSHWEWEKCPWKGPSDKEGIPDAPTTKLNTSYVRHTDATGMNDWLPVQLVSEVPKERPNAVYVRQAADDGTFRWVLGVEEAPASTPGKIYGRKTKDDGTNVWEEISVATLTTLTTAAWKILAEKPEYTDIIDGIYDGTVTSQMYIDD